MLGNIGPYWLMSQAQLGQWAQIGPRPNWANQPKWVPNGSGPNWANGPNASRPQIDGFELY